MILSFACRSASFLDLAVRLSTSCRPSGKPAKMKTGKIAKPIVTAMAVGFMWCSVAVTAGAVSPDNPGDDLPLLAGEVDDSQLGNESWTAPPENIEIPEPEDGRGGLTSSQVKFREEYLVEVEPGKNLGTGGRYTDYGRGIDPWNWASMRCSSSSVEGTLMRITSACTKGKLATILIDPVGHKVVSRKEVNLTAALPIIGGVAQMPDGYIYVLSGQGNPDELGGTEVIRMTKYDTSLTVIGSAGISSDKVTNILGGVWEPFSAGSASMAMVQDRLFIHTSRELPKDSKGVHHQTNLTLSLNPNTMDDFRSNGIVYASHSFNQIAKSYSDGQGLALADHGDAYPRQIFVTNGGTGSGQGTSISALMLTGTIGDNFTYSTLNGMETVGSRAIITGTSAPHNEPVNGKTGIPANKAGQHASNVYLVSVDLEEGAKSRTFKWLTLNDPTDSTTIVGQPTITALPGGDLVVLFHVASTPKYERSLEYRLVTAGGEVLVEKSFPGIAYAPSSEPALIGEDSLYWVGAPEQAINNLDYTQTKNVLQGLDLTDPYSPVMFKAPMKTFSNTSAPTITGTAVVGSQVRASMGSWTPKPSGVSYQWYRDGNRIEGATAATYLPVAADINRTLTVTSAGSLWGYKTVTKTSAGIKVKAAFNVGGAGKNITISRHNGTDRYETSLLVNKKMMAPNAPLYVASGASFPDALSIGPVVRMNQGSLVLTAPGEMGQQMRDLIATRRPSAIYIIGGTNAVSNHVSDQLQRATGLVPQRVSGKDRYETSAQIFSTFFKDRQVSEAFVATGQGYADALTAAAAGGVLNAPVLLVNGTSSNTLPSGVLDGLKAKGAKNIHICGGGATVNGNIEQNLRQTFQVHRLSGGDRYQTNIAVNNYLSSVSSIPVSGVWVATGANFPDALSAAVPAGNASQRLVLSNGSCLPSPVASEWIYGNASQVKTVDLVGGTSVLSESVKNLSQCD